MGLVVVDDQYFGRGTCGSGGSVGRWARDGETHDNDLIKINAVGPEPPEQKKRIAVGGELK
jgi:hypothetical protein